jgi:hypothetical protein
MNTKQKIEALEKRITDLEMRLAIAEARLATPFMTIPVPTMPPVQPSYPGDRWPCTPPITWDSSSGSITTVQPQNGVSITV